MNEQARAVLDENILGVLATVNDDGTPWASPIHVVTDGEAVYWFSSENTTHSRNSVNRPTVSLAVFSPDESNGPTGVYFNGTVEKVPDEERSRIVALYANRAGSFPPAFDGAAAYRLMIGYQDEDKSTGRCWYFYS